MHNESDTDALDLEPLSSDAPEDAPEDGREDSNANAPPVPVPIASLSEGALDGVINSFVLREGTDYGEHETSHASKVAQIRRQLERGEISIFYDASTQSVTLLTQQEQKRLFRER